MEDAVAAHRAALEEYTRERAPLNWAATQNQLNKTLRLFSEKKGGTAQPVDGASDDGISLRDPSLRSSERHQP